MRQLLVDYSLIGHGRRFALRLLPPEREGLAPGSRVQIVGDGIPPRIAEVTAVSDDGKVFEFVFSGWAADHLSLEGARGGHETGTSRPGFQRK